MPRNLTVLIVRSPTQDLLTGCDTKTMVRTCFLSEHVMTSKSSILSLSFLLLLEFYLRHVHGDDINARPDSAHLAFPNRMPYGYIYLETERKWNMLPQKRTENWNKSDLNLALSSIGIQKNTQNQTNTYQSYKHTKAKQRMPFPPVCATLCQKDPVSCRPKGWNIPVNLSSRFTKDFPC